ncbi:MAG: L-lactate dehydrogenase [Lachnospiraceae bacterium]|nr:L-lactate dehydrogenase [Lachnospiraceae bacterium]
MKQTHRDKIVVIGAGNVGEAVAYTLMVRAQANDIVLIDLNEDRAQGAALDIGHGTSFYKQIWIRKGGYEECADAKLIIITAGIARKPGQTRLDLAKVNINIVTSVTKSIMEYAKNPLIIVVSNPADITTMAVQKTSGLPANRVIGSGTSLDTARFRYILSKKLTTNIEDIHAYVVGEHGDSQVAIFSSADVAGFKMRDYAAQLDVKLDEEYIAEYTKKCGAEIIRLKGATFYGVAMAVSNIVEALMKDESAIIPVAHTLDESWGDWAGIAISLPCRLGWDGIEQTLRIEMDEKETAAVNHSVEVLREFAKNTGVIE